MQVTVNVAWQNDHAFRVQLENSQKAFVIDKKTEDHVPSGPNSLEVFLSSLGGCIGIYAVNYLKRHNVPFKELKVKSFAEFGKSSPQRLTDITVRVLTDADLKDKKDVFLRFIHNCPVHHTLLHTDSITIEVGGPDA